MPDSSDTPGEAETVDANTRAAEAAKSGQEIAPIRIGDFEIIRQLGAGGMGIVYLARQTSLNRQVALKVMGASLTRDSDMIRFQREAQAVAKLCHPNIASVHFIGQDDKLCYMAMEYIDGVSLRNQLERLSQTIDPNDSIDKCEEPQPVRAQLVRFDKLNEKPPSNKINPYRSPQAEQIISSTTHCRRCAELVRDVSKALQHAHDNGVIHRDLKPDNLMLDKQGEVHIIDFGLAKFFEDATLTQTGALVGTPIYMSPEQVTGRIELDHRTDIYSLGIVLYELLVLRKPITGSTRDHVLRNIIVKQLRPIQNLNMEIPAPLACVVHKATSKDPDQRYQSANEFSADLDRFLTGKDVEASTYTYAIDLTEIKGRRPTDVLIIAFLAILTGIGTLFTWVFVASWSLEGEVYKGSLSQNWFPLSILLALVVATSVFPMFAGVSFASGRRWARYALSTTLLLFGFWMLTVAFLYASGWRNYIVSALFGILGAIVVVYGSMPFYDKEMRDWFSFAHRLRSNQLGEEECQ